MNEELMRALAAQQQGQAQLPGLELQLERANALRDQQYNQRRQYQQGGIGAAMGGIGNLISRNTGRKRAQALNPQLEQARSQIASGEREAMLQKYRRQEEQDAIAAEGVEYSQGRDAVADDQWERKFALAKATAAQAAADKRRRGPIRGKALTKTAKSQSKAVVNRAAEYDALVKEAEANPYYLQPLRKSGIPSNKIPQLLASAEKGGWSEAVKRFVPGSNTLAEYAEKMGLSSEEMKKYLIYQGKITRLESSERHELFGSALTKLEDKVWRDSRGRYPGMDAAAQLATLKLLRNETARFAQLEGLSGLGGYDENDPTHTPGLLEHEQADFERFYSEFPGVIQRDPETGLVRVDPRLSVDEAYETAKAMLAKTEGPKEGAELLKAAANSTPAVQEGVNAALQEKAAEEAATARVLETFQPAQRDWYDRLPKKRQEAYIRLQLSKEQQQ